MMTAALDSVPARSRFTIDPGAWMGPAEVGKAMYYRIHGPTVLIEYDSIVQPNTRFPSDLDHIHTVMRVPSNDFGDDWLRRHHFENHQKL
jgi:Protein of unknown function (DUF3500)